MAANDENEATPLLFAGNTEQSKHHSVIRTDEHSTISATSQEEPAHTESFAGERLPYNDYTTIDWLQDLVKDSSRYRTIRAHRSLRHKIYVIWDQSQGWVAAALIGILTACVAFIVDMGVATVSDWKTGYCITNPLASRQMCCTKLQPLNAQSRFAVTEDECQAWHNWSEHYYASFAIYVAWALLFGIISAGVTMTTYTNLPAASPGRGDKYSAENRHNGTPPQDTTVKTTATGKGMYLAAGSGIPEIKTILSGFVIPHILDFKILVVKAVGSIFAVSTGMCLGKEGPFVHISTCVANLVGLRFEKFRTNSRKLREVLAAGCSSGLSVAFGAPIGGVLFAYEEISTYFPRKVLWRAFICSLFAAMTLKHLNPTGTGKLVLFETNYGTTYGPVHYIVFIFLGIAGGLFGGAFCSMNFLWSRTFRKLTIIKDHPVLEVFIVVAVTALTQYPNTLTRDPGDVVIKNLLVDCNSKDQTAFVCQYEIVGQVSFKYLGLLIYGTLLKLVLTIITFGIKVPSGIIIPALDAGAFFGRLVGQLPFLSSTISPGIFAMVGAGSFLAGVSRMTISLAVIMFELTGELEFIVPNMIGIMIAKWVADWLEPEGVYDLAQAVLGHPFLDLDASHKLVARRHYLVSDLTPPEQTMRQITVEVPSTGTVPYAVLTGKLEQLKERGLMDAGLVLVQTRGRLLGYLSESELEYGLHLLGSGANDATHVRVVSPHFNSRREEMCTMSSRECSTDSEDSCSSDIPNTKPGWRYGHAGEEELDLCSFVDRNPLTIVDSSPMEYCIEMFGKLGLRYLIVTEQATGKVIGVIIKKRLVSWLDSLKHGDEDD